jgi:hypothetical protein
MSMQRAVFWSSLGSPQAENNEPLFLNARKTIGTKQFHADYATREVVMICGSARTVVPRIMSERINKSK